MAQKLEFEWENVTPENVPILEKFERDVLPQLVKFGPYIGEMAQMGHRAAHEILVRHQGLQHGMPEARQYNFDRIVLAFTLWKQDWESMKSAIHSPRVVH